MRAPRRLTEAVHRLPPAKGEQTVAQRSIDQLRAHILSLSDERLARWRMRPRARAALPMLAVEHSDPELRRRVIVLARQEAARFTWRSVFELLPHLYEDEGLCVVLRARVQGDPPARQVPRWFRDHQDVILQQRDAPQAIATHLRQQGVPLCEATRHLQISAGSALGAAILEAMLQDGGANWLAAQPFTATLRWIEGSGGPAAVRRATLLRALNTWAPHARAPLDTLDPGPLTELLDVALAWFPSTPERRPGAWSQVSPPARQAVRWRRRVRTIQRAFQQLEARPSGRTPFWAAQVDHLRRAALRGPALVIDAGQTVFIEGPDPQAPLLSLPPGGWPDGVDQATPIPRTPGWQGRVLALLG